MTRLPSGTEQRAYLCLSLSVSGLLSKHLVSPKESPYFCSYQKPLLASSTETVDCGQTGEESGATVVLGSRTFRGRIGRKHAALSAESVADSQGLGSVFAVL